MLGIYIALRQPRILNVTFQLTNLNNMALSDKLIGSGMIFVALFVFIYYTVWAVLLPFLDKSNPLHDLFPAREWAVRLPAFLFVVGLASVGLFVGSTIIKENRKRALKSRQRTA